MWLILKLVGLLVLSAYFSNYEDLTKNLNKIIESGAKIDKKYKLVNFINEGTFGVVFKGIKLDGNVPVAMKFVKADNLKEIEREFEILSYLNAINNPDVEKYGIPVVYDYSAWDKSVYMVFSLFEFDLIDAVREGKFNYTSQDNHKALNSLILFKDFVRQSKYMHSRGVRHNDIKPDNIMFRGAQSFLIDYNLASKLDEENNGGSLLYSSRRGMKNEVRNAFDDFEGFLYTMCALNDVELEWFKLKPFQGLKKRAAIRKCGEMKDATDVTISTINDTIKYEPLRKVFMTFASETFKTGSSFPDYNHLDKIISAEIKAVTKSSRPAVYTWIPAKKIDIARKELSKLSDTVTGIPEPSKVKKFEYADPWHSSSEK